MDAEFQPHPMNLTGELTESFITIGWWKSLKVRKWSTPLIDVVKSIWIWICPINVLAVPQVINNCILPVDMGQKVNPISLWLTFLIPLSRAKLKVLWQVTWYPCGSNFSAKIFAFCKYSSSSTVQENESYEFHPLGGNSASCSLASEVTLKMFRTNWSYFSLGNIRSASKD